MGIKTLSEYLDTRDADELRPKVINFLLSGEKIDDESISRFSTEQAIDKEQIYSVLYKILEDFFHYGHYQEQLKKGKVPDFDEMELAKGKKVEMEHTAGPIISELIAKDHLVEDPKYYTHLLAMEDKYAKEL